MPIEIRELVIRAEVDGGGNTAVTKQSSGLNQAEIVQEVVDKVLDVLKQQNER